MRAAIPREPPFQLPVGVVRLRAERCAIAAQPGLQSVDLFRRAYKTELVRSSCLLPRSACMRSPRAGPIPCRDESGTCRVPALFGAWSDGQGRSHPDPVGWWIQPVGAGLELELVLWGGRAVALRHAAVETAWRALRDSVAAEDLTAEPLFEGTLGEWAGRVLPASAERVLVELATPCDVGWREKDDPRPFSFAAVLGNLAHDLVQWAFHDHSGERTSKASADALADAARDWLQQLAGAVQIDGGGVEHVVLGSVQSGGSGRKFPLAGYLGFCTLRGDLEPLLPWLAALALRGAGSHKSHGLGHVRLWFPPAF